MNPALLNLAKRLHRFKTLRTLAKRAASGWTVSQPFHGGTICLDAVEHSWAWVGGRSLETFDRFLQDHLLELSTTRPHLIDIGCNLDVMSLAVLLRNPHATAVAFDLNRRAIDFNGMGDPVRVVEALRRRGDLQLKFIDGGDVRSFDPTQFRHLQADWPDA